MEINGRDYNFFMGTRAAMAIADLCADGDLDKVETLFTGMNSKTLSNTIKCAVYLSRDYEDYQKFNDDSYEPVYLTEKDCAFMDLTQINALCKAVIPAIKDGFTRTIKAKAVEAPKKELSEEEK